MNTCVLPRPRCGRWVGVYAALTVFAILLVVVRRFGGVRGSASVRFVICSCPLSVDVANREVVVGSRHDIHLSRVVRALVSWQMGVYSLGTSPLPRHGCWGRRLHVLHGPEGPR